MPFELRALEAALFAGISVLELAVGNLEGMAFPALDELILHVSRHLPISGLCGIVTYLTLS